MSRRSCSFALFAVLDILIVDWLIICTLRPRRLVYPGTEDCAGWHDYGFHVREQLRTRAVVGASQMYELAHVLVLLVWSSHDRQEPEA